MPETDGPVGSVAAVHELGLVYPGGHRALDRISAEFPAGGLTALIGHNGSGKTTLLKALAGRLRPSEGRVRTLGRNPWDPPRSLRARLGYVPQEIALDPEMTGRETLELFAVLHRLPRRAGARRIHDLATLLGLEDHLGRRVAVYSGGLRRRLHLAVGMLHQPRLFLWDEPASGLDPEARAGVWDALLAHRRSGGSSVVVSHDLAQVERHADRVALLSQGRLEAWGTPDEIRQNHARPGYEIRLTRPPADAGELEARLVGLEGVAGARVRGERVELDVDRHRADTEAALLAAVRRDGAGVAWLRAREADLDGAFRSLTGRGLDRDGS